MGLRWNPNVHHYKQSEMPYLTSPYRRARRDTQNQVLVHPIQSLDDNAFMKIMTWAKLKQEAEGHWATWT
jgi:hypothetical protein